MATVAINGLGRIGRATLKIVMDTPGLELVAANELAAADEIVYLLKHDTVYGRYEKAVSTDNGSLAIGDTRVALLCERNPVLLPWRSLGVDIVFECTGVFARRDELIKHVQAGAKYVILSAPSKSDDVETIVHGVNRPHHCADIISCASCTTNCITPVIELLGRRIGIRKALMTTVHAYTASQHLVDGPHRHIRRGRAGAANFVPTTTGAAAATTKALPEYLGRFDGIASRAPVPVGSIADVVVLTARPTTVAEVNDIFTKEAATDRYRGIVGVTDEQLVSSDIIKDSRAAIVDVGMTQVVDGDLVKVVSWYDNEWGYSSQMVREAQRIAKAIDRGAPESTPARAAE
jgi:glyceraldehyde 3-phosphate dehydrogenase